MYETQIVVHGNVASEPVAREGRNGNIYTTFRVATTPRRKGPDGNYFDLDTTYYSVIAFDRLAGNVASSVRKGHPVTVAGSVSQKAYVNNEGEPRQSLEIQADHVGHDLRWGRSVFSRVSKGVALGFDRTASDDIRTDVQALNEGLERRPANVDANGEIHGEVHGELEAVPGETHDPQLTDAIERGYGDPETDPYELEQPAA